MRQRAHRAGSEEPLSWGVSGGFRPECVPKDSAGNRLAEQIDDVVTSASYNNMNQLVSQQAGGALVFKGTVSELANVTIAGRPAVVTPNASQPPSQDFQGAVPVPAGGQVQVTATDPSGNTRTSTYQVATGTPKAFTYDLNGNMASDGTRTYEWDAENRLVAVKQGAATVASYTYNYKGIRTSTTVGTVATRYLLEGPTMFEERASTGGVTKHFQGAGIDNVLAMQDPAGAATYLARDHIRSVREYVDGAGVVVLRRDYDPWGSLTVGGGGWSFTGRESDGETGLYYYRARYYAPTMGRFISEDPLDAGTGRSEYSYADGNPISRTDALGLFSMRGLYPADSMDIPRQKWDAVYNAVRTSCNCVDKIITDPTLRNCIKTSCERGTVGMRLDCGAGALGGKMDPQGADVAVAFGGALRTAKICVNNWEDLTSAGIGNVTLHEWAHGCAWHHNQGKGVPLNSGFPD